jgi:asparagine synthase (glutamine-hydrolysing)
MCGIAGFLSPSRELVGEAMQPTVLAMANALQHRGPDDSGTWVDPIAGVALGHRRLSILDLSPLGHQPMLSVSGRHVIVYNGEIYNFRSLRTELESSGHAFRSQSDTEVMLAAITQWGVRDALRRFNGMFAFALWDRQEHTLHLARDRFGEKPLYYGWFDRTLLFGSELKGLRAHPQFEGEVDRDALGLYMRYGYVPTPHCIYRHVRKLPPGTVLKVTGEGSDSSASPEAYWSVSEAALAAMDSPFAGSAVEAAIELECLLDDAVRLRLESDVPLGAFLSGGIDSSTIVALMQRQGSRPVKTFTVGFDEAPYNEADDAKRVAEHLGTEHTELYVSSSDAMAVIPRLPTLYDEPFADSSQIPTFLISSLARSNVTVSLSGDGGDELLGGYNRYLLASTRLRSVFRLPALARKMIGGTLQAVPPLTWDRLLGMLGGVTSAVGRRHVGDKLHRLGGVLTNSGAGDVYSSFMSVWDRPNAVVLGMTDLAESRTVLPLRAHALDEMQRMMLLDALGYLPDDILVKVDRASMGVGLETRMPFLDHRVAEFCWGLPRSLKVRDGQQKWLLHQVLSKYVPQHLVERPKTGFAVPIATWLRGPLKTWAADLLNAGRLRREEFLNADVVNLLWGRHLSGKANWPDRLWCALMFETWLDEQRSSSAPPA